ncbi:MAG: glycoside hydrolase family 25 protein [Bacteroidota bacterium]
MQNTYTAGIADLSHHNEQVDFSVAKAAGLKAVIHKATQSTNFIDPMYQTRYDEASKLGLLFGAYHFGTAGAPEAQMVFFLKNMMQQGPVLPVLDFEPNPDKAEGTMSIAEAEVFVETFQQKTGRYPGLYGGYWLIDKLRDYTGTLLQQCWLWQAYYREPLEIPAVFQTWHLWQYIDGTTGPTPHAMAGIGSCDLDRFNGDEAALKHFWREHAW